MNENVKSNNNLTPNKKVVVKVNKPTGSTMQSRIINKGSSGTNPTSKNRQTTVNTTKNNTSVNQPNMAELARKADEEAKSAAVIVPAHQLSLAIGKEGQNARLAARLTGWKIDIKPDNA